MQPFDDVLILSHYVRTRQGTLRERNALLRYVRAASAHTSSLATKAQRINTRNPSNLLQERFNSALKRIVAAKSRTQARTIAKGYWSRVKNLGRPVVEGSTVHFMYLGKARRVTVPSDLNGWNSSADTMTRLDMTDLFYLSKPIHRAVRFEYKFAVDSRWLVDPLNRQHAMGGYGPNSELWMPGYHAPNDIRYRASIPHGTLHVSTFDSRILRRAHPCFVYLPAVYRHSNRVFPAICVLDGGEYITLALMVNVLDNLIADGRICPVVGVFVDPRTRMRDSKTSKRMTDYTMNERFVQFLADELWDRTRLDYRIDSQPEQTAILGSSLGGLASTFAAFKRPDVFGLCAAQSPSYHWNHSAMIDAVTQEPTKPIRFYIDTGTIRDSEFHARRMREVLCSKGYDVLYAEYPEGHNWVNWRARLSNILTHFWGTSE